MARYYHIACLNKERDIQIDGGSIRVDLSTIGENDHVMDDVVLLERVSPDSLFFLSGGGTLLVNHRYLLMVEREQSARVNPGQFSLFTGRADGPHEWENPPSVTRELFEELLLYKNDVLLYPRNDTYQTIIDAAHSEANRTSNAAVKLDLVDMRNGTLEVTRDGKTLYAAPAFWVISAQGEINLLTLFALDINLDAFCARDGEGTRAIAVLDLVEHRYCMLSQPPKDRHWQDASTLPMSLNLRAVVDYIQAHPELVKA
jgi:hypothetical protein